MYICGDCRGTSECNKDGEPEELLSCVDCGHSGSWFLVTVIQHLFNIYIVFFIYLGHPTCLKLSQEIIAKVRTMRWQCSECKSCNVCGSQNNAVSWTIMFCYLKQSNHLNSIRDNLPSSQGTAVLILIAGLVISSMMTHLVIHKESSSSANSD